MSPTASEPAAPEGRCRSAAMVLDPHGAESPEEFFAVATKAFYQSLTPIGKPHPEFSGELARYYLQDRRSSRECRLIREALDRSWDNKHSPRDNLPNGSNPVSRSEFENPGSRKATGVLLFQDIYSITISPALTQRNALIKPDLHLYFLGQVIHVFQPHYLRSC